MNGLEGLAAVVTGAAGGIGSAISRELSNQGARVVCVDIAGDAVRATAASIVDSGGEAWAIEGDATVPSQVDSAVQEAIDLTGQVHVLCTTVGGAAQIPFLDIDPDTWRQTIDLNVTSTYLFARAVGRHMVEQGTGSIVVTTSQLGHVGREGLAHYCASKGALTQLVKVMALEFAPSGVRANAVAPGPTGTPLLLEAFADYPDAFQALIADVAMKRTGEPAEIANAAAFLASPRASFVTGSTLVVDGGYLAS